MLQTWQYMPNLGISMIEKEMHLSKASKQRQKGWGLCPGAAASDVLQFKDPDFAQSLRARVQDEGNMAGHCAKAA